MAKVISMGDFNDDPTNSGFKKILKTKADKKKVQQGDLYNPMENMYKKGIGTLAYRDSWSLFDQFVLTYGYLAKEAEGYKYWKAGVFNSPELANPSGKYAGYPYRSYANGSYTGGYSDQLPCISVPDKRILVVSGQSIIDRPLKLNKPHAQRRKILFLFGRFRWSQSHEWRFLLHSPHIWHG